MSEGGREGGREEGREKGREREVGGERAQSSLAYPSSEASLAAGVCTLLLLVSFPDL